MREYEVRTSFFRVEVLFIMNVCATNSKRDNKHLLDESEPLDAGVWVDAERLRLDLQDMLPEGVLVLDARLLAHEVKLLFGDRGIRGLQ